jgi:hypothetical protein
VRSVTGRGGGTWTGTGHEGVHLLGDGAGTLPALTRGQGGQVRRGASSKHAFMLVRNRQGSSDCCLVSATMDSAFVRNCCGRLHMCTVPDTRSPLGLVGP